MSFFGYRRSIGTDVTESTEYEVPNTWAMSLNSTTIICGLADRSRPCLSHHPFPKRQVHDLLIKRPVSLKKLVVIVANMSSKEHVGL